ncbi:hypothetical protein CGI93_21695, partial [Vibrio parahaemolyticus]
KMKFTSGIVFSYFKKFPTLLNHKLSYFTYIFRMKFLIYQKSYLTFLREGDLYKNYDFYYSLQNHSHPLVEGSYLHLEILLIFQ